MVIWPAMVMIVECFIINWRQDTNMHDGNAMIQIWTMCATYENVWFFKSDSVTMSKKKIEIYSAENVVETYYYGWYALIHLCSNDMTNN